MCLVWIRAAVCRAGASSHITIGMDKLFQLLVTAAVRPQDSSGLTVYTAVWRASTYSTLSYAEKADFLDWR